MVNMTEGGLPLKTVKYDIHKIRSLASALLMMRPARRLTFAVNEDRKRGYAEQL